MSMSVLEPHPVVSVANGALPPQPHPPHVSSAPPSTSSTDGAGSKRSSAQLPSSRVETPGVKKVEVVRVNNPENYEDDTNQTGLSQYEMKIIDNFYSAPSRPRSKAYTDQVEADRERRTARAERRAEKRERRRSKSKSNSAPPPQHEPYSVGWVMQNTNKTGILNMSKMNLDDIPPEVFDSMPGTARIINISCNRITELDVRICDYVLVQRLIANENLLTSIPTTISRMTALKKLHLASNKLTMLPDAFAGMRFLEQVDVSQNELDSLPPSLTSLNLTALNISRNNFTKAPVEISTMELLMDLDMSYNRLTAVPVEYSALTQLIMFNLDNNNISDFPDQILETCTELVKLRLRSNPLKMTVLEGKDSYSQFNARRNIKFKRQLDAGTITEADLLPADS